MKIFLNTSSSIRKALIQPCRTTVTPWSSRFTTDMWKIAQDGGLSLANANISKMLTAFAMQKYYEEPASGADHGETLFSDVTGGIRFNRTYVADTLDADSVKGYKYFQDYVGSLSFGSNREVFDAELPNLLDWYIQAGSQAMNATAGEQRAFMLGGNGNDILTGGSQADLLVGNSGQDTLDGGAGDDVLMVGWTAGGMLDSTGDTFYGGSGYDRLYGGYGADTLDGGADADLMIGGDGIDTYYIDGNDTIRDTGQNFIYFKDASDKYQLLAGGFVQEEGANTYRFMSDNNISLTFHSPGHMVLNTTDSITFDLQTSAAAFENGDFGIKLADHVEANYTLTGTDGNDDTSLQIWEDTLNPKTGVYGTFAFYSFAEESSFVYSDEIAPPNLEINGGAGNDTLYGLAGSDLILGGSGNDLISGEVESLSDNPVYYALLNPWGLTGQSDILKGEAGKDVILAAYGDDFVSGGDDSDFVDGSYGDDTLAGDNGNDIVAGSVGNDFITGGSGDDLLAGDCCLPDYYAQLTTADIDSINFQMTYDADLGYPSSVAYTNCGLIDTTEPGDDIIFGGSGNDYLLGGGGTDMLFGEEDNDTLFGDRGDNNEWNWRQAA